MQSKAMTIIGYILSILFGIFMLMDAVMKLMKPKFVVDGTVQLGYPENVIIPLGVVLTLCTILYLIPRTSVLGAILLTGYLGGAVASHVRAQQGWFPITFATLFGVVAWLGIFLREPRLRAILPVRS